MTNNRINTLNIINSYSSIKLDDKLNINGLLKLTINNEPSTSFSYLDKSSAQQLVDHLTSVFNLTADESKLYYEAHITIEPVFVPVDYNSITPQERRKVREEYVRLQAGNCYYCKFSLNTKPSKRVLSKQINKSLFPPSFFKHPIHLHHDRNTGLTIGAVHNYCNAVLWEYYNE